MRRYANKKDSNQDEVVTDLRRGGCMCVDIDLSTGIDLLCGYRGVWFTLEIKSKGGRETKRQKEWAEIAHSKGLPHFLLKEGEPVSWILERAMLYSGGSKRPPEMPPQSRR